MKLFLVIVFALVTTSCQEAPVESVTGLATDSRYITSVSDEIVIDSEDTIDANLDRAFEIIRAVCEGGFYSISCADPANVPPMKIDRDNLVPVEIEVTLMSVEQPNYVFIRCDTEADPAPLDLVQRCYGLVVQHAAR